MREAIAQPPPVRSTSVRKNRSDADDRYGQNRRGRGYDGAVSSTPIADHALLSDCHSAALVSTAGSIEWLCFPRFDSPSTFGRLLDDTAGHWSICPVADAAVTRRYLDSTMVLETTFQTSTGTVTWTSCA